MDALKQGEHATPGDGARRSAAKLLPIWHAQPVTLLPLSAVGTDPALQSRSDAAIPAKDRERERARSADHVVQLRRHLAIAASADLDPILVAEIDGRQLVVDGHHRLMAYRLEKRPCIPAKVLSVNLREAHRVSLQVNEPQRNLVPAGAQLAEACWQALAEDTLRGRITLDQLGTSIRRIEARFGVPKSTVARMIAALPEVRPEEWTATAKNPITGFPLWRHVKSQNAPPWTDIDADERTRARVASTAAKLGKIRDKDPAIFGAALRVLFAEVSTDAEEDAEQRAERAALVEMLTRTELADGESDL